MPFNRHICSFLALVMPSLVLMTGCTQKFYKGWADKQVFGIIGSKKQIVAGAEDEALLSITPPPPVELDRLMKQTEGSEFLGKRAFIEKGAKVVTLADALDFAVHRNRAYLTRKEVVYLQALALTRTRQQYGPIADGGGSSVFTESQTKTGVNNLVRSSTLLSRGGVGLTYLMKTGGILALDLTSDFTRFFTGDVKGLSDSKAAVTLAQPLLRGAGVLAAVEPLRQDERDVLYAIREFTQYRKSFAVEVARQYMRTLQAREQARNRYTANLAGQRNILRDRALAAANLRSQSQLKQLEQGALAYERSWLAAIRSYEDALDDLKITLGLPVTERLTLDSKELKRLDVSDPQGSMDQMVETALVTRLDIYNSRDRLADTERRVKIAHQNTLPTVNALMNYQMGTPRDNEGLELNPKQRRVSGGLDIDLNLNTLPERNDLRSAQISEQATRRGLDLAEEDLRQTIRSDWRGLQLAQSQYALALEGLGLAQKRLEIEEALTAEGQGTARDIVESTDRLITASDQAVSTLIDLNLARLQLWADMGVLYIQKDGAWADVLKSEKVKGDAP
ncbi:MAG: TolC family protein [Verrucomicrobia bacterium]|nr:TolC family protein [Verrucomicrobiota bacterium]